MMMGSSGLKKFVEGATFGMKLHSSKVVASASAERDVFYIFEASCSRLHEEGVLKLNGASFTDFLS